MRAFIVMCLVASAIAAPQGYNYQESSQQFGNGGSRAVSHNSFTQDGPKFLQEAVQNTKLNQVLLNPTNTYHQQQEQQQPRQQQVLQNHQQQYNFNAQPQLLPQLTSQRTFAQQPFPQYQAQPTYSQAAPIVTKDIYVHVAPHEQEEQRNVAAIPLPPPRKHYRIVFIKAPTPSVSQASLRISPAPTEEKTIIYVLTKKPDPVDFQAALQEAPKQPSKPEVYFIKYKTQEEAQHAQRTIQAQYDQLGGTTQVSDEGIAPVTSVIGSLEQQQGSAGAASSADSVINGNGGNGIGNGNGNYNYLPPVARI